MVHFIFTIFDAWLGSSMHSLKEEKKNRSAYCATIWHWDRCVSGHASKCVQKHVQKLHFSIWACIHVHRWFRVHPRGILFSYRTTCKQVLEEQLLQIEVNLASLCAKHVFKEKEKENKLETSNRKVRIYERGKMCGCKVNPVLNRTKSMYWS